MEITDDLNQLQAGLDSKAQNLTRNQLATEAVDTATRQIYACFEFKKARLARLNKYWALYDGKTQKKLRQLFNVPIPVFAGMIDTLNAQYDTGIDLKFREGDAADYFKVQKINGAFTMEVMNTSQNSKWDQKLTMARKHAIMEGRAILEYSVESDPEYKTELDLVLLKNFNFQPQGGLYLENHLFAGREDIEKTQFNLIDGARNGLYDPAQVRQLIALGAQGDYLPTGNHDMATRLARFKPLGLDAENNNYVGQKVYKLVSHILEIKGERWYILFDPWTKIWLRFERWKEISTSGLYPWVTFATHEDEENFLSKSYADDLYSASDAIVSMFNQELTNREKKNFGARAFDVDMFPDVRKLDEAMHRPDALVPVKRKIAGEPIGNGIYKFEVGELNGTVNLIDWITGSLGRNTGATDLAMGSVEEVSKKASVTFAEQNSVSKRIGWGAKPFQNMMGDLGKRFVHGLKDHMPSEMAIRMMGENGWDWDTITRMDLDTTKDIDVLIESRDEQKRQSELRKEKRIKALEMTGDMPLNVKKRAESVLKDVGEYDDQEVLEFLDVTTHADKKSLAKASECIQMVLRNQKPKLWYGATVAFMQKLVDYANDKRSTLGPKFQTLIDFAMAHSDIVRDNLERKISEDSFAQAQQPVATEGDIQEPTPQTSNIPGGVKRAMNVAEAAA